MVDGIDCVCGAMQGMAFTLKERQILGIHGLLPPVVFSPDEQKIRVMENVRRYDDDLDKYIYLAALLDRNEKLFYQVSILRCLT